MAEDDFMVTNGDNLFSPDVFTNLAMENGEGIFLSLTSKDDYDQDDMKVTLHCGAVARVSKSIQGRADAESPGLALVRGCESRKLFADQLEKLVRENGYIDRFWLEVYNGLYQSGVHVHPWYFDGRGKWQEVDFHADVDQVRALVQAQVVRFLSEKDPAPAYVNTTEREAA
jgi:choline kinase